MVNHVIVVQIFQQILRAMEMIIAEFEFSLNDIDCGVTCPECGHMIGTAATTCCLDP
jgi:hypothetical protein